MPDNTVKIEIDGQDFTAFKTGSITKRMDALCGTFNIVTTKDLIKEYNIPLQSICRIFLNGKKRITGIIDNVSPNEDSESSEVNISGRDISCDIVDSDLPSVISLSGEFSLKTLIEKVINVLGLNIKVINRVNRLRGFTKSDIVSSEVDKNAFEFINDYAQKLSVILVTDEDGNIIITRGGLDGKYSGILLNEIVGIDAGTGKRVGNPDNNIISSSAGYDFSQRFNKYIVYSQSNANTTKQPVTLDAVQQKGIAYDSSVRASRVKVIKAENACNSETCQEIANLEANIRRANSLQYSNEVYGWETRNGELYNTNKIIPVKDDDCEIDSNLLIKSVTFNFGEGSTTSLEFCEADAYTLQAEMDEINAKINKTKSSKTKKKKKKKGVSQAEISQLEKLMGIK